MEEQEIFNLSESELENIGSDSDPGKYNVFNPIFEKEQKEQTDNEQ